MIEVREILDFFALMGQPDNIDTLLLCNLTRMISNVSKVGPGKIYVYRSVEYFGFISEP